MSTRPTKHDYLMAVANLTSKMSTCQRLQVGTVLATRDLTQFVVGYNGGPKGGRNACARETAGDCGCVHAEMNAVAKATPGVHVVCFTTDSPCELCAVLLVNSGVEEVYYQREYRKTDHLVGLPIEFIHVPPANILQVEASAVPRAAWPGEETVRMERARERWT